MYQERAVSQPVISAEDNHQVSIDALDAKEKRARLWGMLDRLAILTLLIGSWEWTARNVVDPFFISMPSRIAVDVWGLVASGTIWQHMAITLYSTFAGLAIGSIVGIVLGVGLSFWSRLSNAMEPYLVAFNSMPRIAIAPLFLIWFGIGFESKMALAASVVVFVVFYNTFVGIRTIDPVFVYAVRTMGGDRFAVLRYVLVPATFSWIFAAMKTSVPFALIGAVVGEFLGSMGGLGWMITQASATLNTARVFSVLCVLAALGMGLDWLVRLVERRVLGWQPSVRL